MKKQPIWARLLRVLTGWSLYYKTEDEMKFIQDRP